MNCIDVFNGDADGICALHQLRLQHPQPTPRLVTGVKRDISLLSQLKGVANSRITVLDISLDRNREALTQLLAHGNDVLYIDHHFSGSIPESSSLVASIDPSPQCCTSLLVDQRLGGIFRPWAIAGAFGDNLDEVATEYARAMQLPQDAIDMLQEIGQLINYNGYGLTLDDLHVHPAELFLDVQCFRNPIDFYSQSKNIEKLRAGYCNDIALANGLQPLREYPGGRVFALPDTNWARRIIGVFSNQLAREKPTLAHATLLPTSEGSLMISVRAPLTQKSGADALCRQFPTGGGRAAAAGINTLPWDEVDRFLSLFASHFPPPR